jgi:hypothetical protein
LQGPVFIQRYAAPFNLVPHRLGSFFSHNRPPPDKDVVILNQPLYLAADTRIPQGGGYLRLGSLTSG